MVDTAKAAGDARPGRLTQLFLRMPLQMYRLGFAGQLGKNFLVLKTTGRRTGRLHEVAVDYITVDGRIYLFVGYGPRTDWYRNALAHPQVTVQIGEQRLEALARSVDDVAERQRLLGVLRQQVQTGVHGPPRLACWLMKRLGILDYDAEVARTAARADQIPVIEIVPVARGQDRFRLLL